MDIVNYVSVDYIFDRLKREFPYDDKYTNVTDMTEWIGDFLELLPNKQRHIEKVTNCTDKGNPNIVVSNYRADLPCDFKELIQARLVSQNDTTCKITMKKSTDLFIVGNDSSIDNLGEDHIKQYHIKNKILHTNFEEGEVELAYIAVPLDENGKPLVPDVEQVIDAAVKYIAHKIDYMLLRLGQLNSSIYMESKAQYDNAFRKACSKLQMPNQEDAYNIANHHIKIGSSLLDHKYNYKYKGNRGR